MTTRAEIDVAVGVLMALRGCPPSDAADELKDAVPDTGSTAVELGRALAALASGTEEVLTPWRAEVLQRWGHLMAARGLGDARHAELIPDAIRIRHGPRNEATMC